MSALLKFLGQTGWIICVLFIQGALCIDFSDPDTLALTIGCAIGGVIVLILVVTLCAFCYFRSEGEEAQSQQGRSFDYDPGFHTRNGHPAYPPNHHSNNNSSLLNGGSTQSHQDSMNVPPGVWTTNPSMFMGPHPPQGPYMTNGSYGSNPRPRGGGYPPPPPAGYPPPQQSLGRPPPPGPMPVHYMNGYYTQEPPRQTRPPNKKSWYHRTIGRAQQALKNIPAVFQVKQSTKETMTYKKLMKKEEERKRHQAMHNAQRHQNGDVTSAARERHDVSRSSSNARRLPRNDAEPQMAQEEPEVLVNDPHVPTPPSEPTDTAEYSSVQPVTMDDRPEPPVAKAFSDYREPADVLPPADEHHVARAFSSFERGLDNNSRFVARAFSRQESEHKYALPQDALPLTQSEFGLDRNQHRISRTARSDEQYSPFTATKYSNYGYVPGTGGSAGPVVGSRIPGQRGVVMQSPSDAQRLANYRSTSLERTASQYRNNMPQRGRTRAEIVQQEKAAKLAAKQQKSKLKSKPSSKDKQVTGIMKTSANKHQQSTAVRPNTEVGVARSYQTVPGPKNAPTHVTQHPAHVTQQPAHVAQQPTHVSQPIAAEIIPSHTLPQQTQAVHQSSPALIQDDPIYARPTKVKREAREKPDLSRPMSIDVPTSNPAPFVIPDTPISPEPPAVPPHPAEATPKTAKHRNRHKSESASAEFALAGDDVTSSAFQFLEDIDTDADASFREEHK